MSEQRPLQTAGEMLAEGRQRLSCTVEQVAASTKIPIHILQAIELDEYHKLSDPLYIKSFLRTYAQHVGLDPDTVLQVYLQFTGGGKDPAADEEAVWAEEVKIQRVGLPWGKIGLYVVGAAALVCIGLLLVLRGCAGRDADVAKVTSAVAEERSEIVETAPAEPTVQDREISEPPRTNDAHTVSSPSDTLAMGWQQSSETPAPEAVLARQGKSEAPPVPSSGKEDRVQPGSTPETGVVFADGRSWPVVMRLLCQSPVGVAVQRDADRDFRIVFWPEQPAALPGRPDEGVEHGRAYAVREGLAVYWGARDHFTLRLDQVQGVRVFINGQERDVSAWAPGDEMLLDSGSRPLHQAD